MWAFLKIHSLLLAVFFISLLNVCTHAATYYVDINCANPTPPYTDWSTAATNIQDAVAAARPGDLVFVTNGVYSGTGSQTICVNITNAITVQSANGPSLTIIQAYPTPGTTNGTRQCVFLGASSTLSGFTLMNGATNSSVGGVNCHDGSSIVTNCIITGNSGNTGGGYDGSYYNCIISYNTGYSSAGGIELVSSGACLNNCVIFGNSSRAWVGGVGCSFGNYLINCTVVNNVLTAGGMCGGVYGGSLTNCIVYYNLASFTQGTNLANTAALNNCCVAPTNVIGANNIVSAPGFVNVDAGNLQLAQWSPCIDAGNNAVVTSPADLNGNPRVVNDTVDIGAYEYQYFPAVTVHFVSLNNATPVSPFTNWLTAATNIQAAIEASAPGDFVVVSNGIYNTGTKTNLGMIGNRIAVDVPVTVQGLAGNGYTEILGNYPFAPNVRCAYLTNGATLIGLTLTNGYSSYTGNPGDGNGGGAWCQSTLATLVNCVIVKNQATINGGGTYSGTLVNCTLVNNQAQYGGGALFGVLTNCAFTNNIGFYAGGATCSNTLYNCTLVKNTSPDGDGGGAYLSLLNGCILSGNTATNNGGGAIFGTLVNCTLTNNFAWNGGACVSNILYNCLLIGNTASNSGGGSFYSILTNCTVLQNKATNFGGGIFGGTVNNCLISSNLAGARGGGACYATLANCLLITNIANYGGGSASNTLNNCFVANNRANLFGGGTYNGTQNNCLITNNVGGEGGGGSAFGTLNNCSLLNNFVPGTPSKQGGGGAFDGTLISCLISNNISIANGGGAINSILTNCLIVNNSALPLGISSGGGTYNCYLENCTVMYNTNRGVVGGATNSIIYYNTITNFVAGIYSLQNCCTFGTLTGSGSIRNITNAPLLVSAGSDFHLQSTSPCISSGNNAFVSIATDFDGNPRVQGTVDLGAYEYQTPGSVISYAWLQQYGLPTDGSVDFTDLDGTGDSVYQDWVAGINPTNPAAGLMLFTPRSAANPSNSITGIIVSWQSTANIVYALQRSTNLSAQPPFSTIQSNITGQANTTSYTDTSATNNSPYFYRVEVP